MNVKTAWVMIMVQSYVVTFDVEVKFDYRNDRVDVYDLLINQIRGNVVKYVVIAVVMQNTACVLSYYVSINNGENII